MKAVYVVSTPDKADNNIYKLGSHFGDVHRLIGRYTTYLLHPIVYYFCYIDSNIDIESALKDEFVDERILNWKNKKSEWINLPLKQIVKCLNLLTVNANRHVVVDVAKHSKQISVVYPKIIDSDNSKRYSILTDYVRFIKVDCHGVDLKRLKIVDDLLDIIRDVTGFDIIENNNIVFSFKRYTKLINRIATQSKYFNDMDRFRPMFFTTKANYKDDKDSKFYMTITNDIMKKYNIVFKTGQRVKKNNITKRNYHLYVINVDPNIIIGV